MNRACVLTVPMRNGNYNISVIKEKGNKVLTVPMRNGNFIIAIAKKSIYKVLTVPMRNGNMEWLDVTLFQKLQFLPYL